MLDYQTFLITSLKIMLDYQTFLITSLGLLPNHLIIQSGFAVQQFNLLSLAAQ